MNSSKNTSTIQRNSIYIRKLNPSQLEKIAGGGKGPTGQAVTDFIAWIACGFNHHYVDTGKTKVVMDGPIPTKFKQVKCRDCGHKTWVRVGIAFNN